MSRERQWHVYPGAILQVDTRDRASLASCPEPASNLKRQIFNKAREMRPITWRGGIAIKKEKSSHGGRGVHGETDRL